MKNWGLDQDNTNGKALMGLIMFDLWFWKLIFKEIERISWYGVSFKLW
jgi:hypothetical protein